MSNDKNSTLTCSELIRELQKWEKEGYGDAPMQSEGCDCMGDVRRVTLSKYNGQNRARLGAYMRNKSEVITPEAACRVVERWRKEREFRADLPPQRLRDAWTDWEERDSGLIDFRGDLYRGQFPDGTRDRWRPMAELGGFKDPGLWYFRPHGTTWAEVERLAHERDEASQRIGDSIGVTKDTQPASDEDLTDLRKLDGRTCTSPYNLIAKANSGRFTIPMGLPFRVVYSQPDRDNAMVECDGKYGWLSTTQEVDVLPPKVERIVQQREDAQGRLCATRQSVILTSCVSAAIDGRSKPFTVVSAQLRSHIEFKAERLTIARARSAHWRNGSTSKCGTTEPLEELTVMRIRVDGKDVTPGPTSAWGIEHGCNVAWPIVPAGGLVDVTFAISDVVLNCCAIPPGLSKRDLRYVWVELQVSLHGGVIQ